MAEEPRIKLGGAELVDDLEPLWLALHEHHQLVLPGFDYHPPATSWRIRRGQYLRWLSNPDAFVLVAYDGPRPVGYALVEIVEGPEDTWVSGDRLGELQTLSVASDWRGRGLGTVLLDRVDAELEKRGIHDLMLEVLEGNEAARRLYERRGLRPVMTTMARFGRA
jgi:ribosomal protein S18 acetylase RimI-like enzyme